MRQLLPVLTMVLATPVAAQGVPALLTGTFTNEEQVYFDGEAGKPPPPWLGAEVSAAGNGLRWRTIDMVGASVGSATAMTVSRDGALLALAGGGCTRLFKAGGESWIAAGTRGTCALPALTRIDVAGLTYTLDGGATTLLRRARAFKCWVAVRKRAPKPDGKDDWTYDKDVPMHDQGSRATLGGGDSGADPVSIRLRHVVWPHNGNENIVLYIHKPDDPVRAVAYSWADIGATQVGINLRFVQASCSLAATPRPMEK
ncbi:MAG: hypothetical protein ACRCUI_13865 [Polymorphobacter sp.]